MRRCAAILVALMTLVVGLPGGAPRAAIVPTGGPNPNWNEAQKFEWYLGYLAQAARICGAASSELTRLARMSPYGVIGLTQYRADGFYRAACVRYRAAIAEVLADAEEIENNIERTYECEDEGCYGQDLSDWQFHTCGNSLKSHVAILGIEYEDVREVTLLDPAKLGSSAAYLARIQFHSCQGSLYIDLNPQCIMQKTQTRGACEIDGVERY